MEGGRHGILSKMQRNFTQNVDLDRVMMVWKIGMKNLLQATMSFANSSSAMAKNGHFCVYLTWILLNISTMFKNGYKKFYWLFNDWIGDTGFFTRFSISACKVFLEKSQAIKHRNLSVMLDKFGRYLNNQIP